MSTQRYRCELRIKVGSTITSFDLRGFDNSLKSMGGAGVTLAPDLLLNPRTTITAASGRGQYTLRSAFVADVESGASGRVYSNTAAFLNGAGLRGFGTNDALTTKLRRCGSEVCLTVRPWAAATVRRSGSSASSGRPAETVAPVPLSPVERAVAGPVLQSSVPSEVGQTPRVVSVQGARDLGSLAIANPLLFGVGLVLLATGVVIVWNKTTR